MKHLLDRLIVRTPYAARALRTVHRAYEEWSQPEPFPRGHFYSPLPDLAWVRANRERLFRQDVADLPAIDLRRSEQRALLETLHGYYADFRWPESPSPEHRYHLGQDAFRIGDALSLYGMLRHFRPRRVLEVGSGHSSALMLDVADRFLDGNVQFTFVEPFPAVLESQLRPEDRARVTILAHAAQEVPISTFTALESGDLLFIDSTHISRIGSDVNYLVFEVLPALRPGVLIHFHDIIWPFEYFERWVISGIAWNEAYVLRAFLAYNERFEILLFNSMLGHEQKDFFQANMPRFLEDTGGSLWLRKVG